MRGSEIVISKRSPLDDCFHTNQLWCEDSWRYSVVEVLLELQQLTHEVKVWRDDGPPGFDKLVGVCHGHPGVLHQIGDHDGGGSRHACLAVDQKAHTCLMCFLCREEQIKQNKLSKCLVPMGKFIIQHGLILKTSSENRQLSWPCNSGIYWIKNMINSTFKSYFHHQSRLPGKIRNEGMCLGRKNMTFLMIILQNQGCVHFY